MSDPIDATTLSRAARRARQESEDAATAPAAAPTMPRTLEDALERIASRATPASCGGAFVDRSSPRVTSPASPTTSPQAPSLVAAHDAAHGIATTAAAPALPYAARSLVDHAIVAGDYRLHPAVDDRGCVLYYAAFHVKTRRVDYVVGPDAAQTFAKDPDGYAHAAVLTNAHGAPSTQWERESIATSEALVRDGPRAGLEHLASAWSAAVRDPRWWGDVVQAQALGVATAEIAKAPRYAPAFEADPTLPRGTGMTDANGSVRYSPHGTAREVALVKAHESVHQALTPTGLGPMSRLAGAARMALYDRSQLCRYVEEALAESYAQVKVNGASALPEGLRFPFGDPGYELTVSVMVTEAAAGTVVFAGAIYGVYVVEKER